MPGSSGYAPGPTVITADGVEIATYDLGGEGPALLLAHATGFHGRMWLPVAAHLRHRYHCIAFDERGQGLSGKDPDGGYRWAGFALDARAVIEGWRLERPFGAGHSCGGALLLAVEEAYPGTFESLYCFEPVVFTGVESGLASQHPLAERTRHRRETFPTRRAAVEHYRAKMPLARFDAAALEAYVEYGFEDLPDGAVRLRCRRQDEVRIYEQGPYNDVFGGLERVACPVTLACGDDGPHFDRAHIERLAGHLARARTEVISGTGHFGPYERPAEIAAAIINAFEAVAANG